MSVLPEAMRFAHADRLFLVLVPLAMAVVRWLMRGHGFGGPVPQRKFPFALGLAWLALVVALAGPQYGTEPMPEAVGRDVVLVLDVSRSMWANDVGGSAPRERWQAAVAGAKSLVEALRAKGGTRVGVVIFAGRPKRLAPLTTDLDHVHEVLAKLDARTAPADVRPEEGSASGTRIGAGLVAALAVHEAGLPGFRDIVLFTDGDDPADDREWQAGVTAARQAQVPIHVVALGDPARESPILRDGEPLQTVEGVRRPVQTRLHEEVTQAIAAEGRGLHVASGTEVPRLAGFVQDALEANPNRERADDTLPQPRAWAWLFLLAATALLTWTCCRG